MMAKHKLTSEANSETLLQEIARNHLFLETLEPRNVDSLDFHDHPVWAAHVKRMRTETMTVSSWAG